MGGKMGGGIPLGDLQKLEERAKEKLKEAEDSSPHTFISFANEDLDDVNLLRGQAKNEKTDLKFDDHSVKEPYDSVNAEYIKRQIREKLDRSSVTLVYLTPDSAKSPWVNWEIEESIKRGKGVIGVYKGEVRPAVTPPAFSKNRCKSVQWTHDNLVKAINDARKKR